MTWYDTNLMKKLILPVSHTAKGGILSVINSAAFKSDANSG